MTTPHFDASASSPARLHARRLPAWRFAGLVGLIVVLGGAALTGLIPSRDLVARAAQDSGPLAALMIVGAVAVLVAALVPRTVLAAAAGLTFGAAWGALYVLAGALVGAVVAFAVGRVLGRDFVRSRPMPTRVDRLLRRRGLLSVVTVRLLPVAPFGLVSYLFGTTEISMGAYLLGTALGIAPGTVVFAVVGASALQPTSPAFIAACVAAGALVAAAAVGGRRIVRPRRLP
jgi:uncharacterized membrane protein YdjX (TVP38/TMEM64 family)